MWQEGGSGRKQPPSSSGLMSVWRAFLGARFSLQSRIATTCTTTAQNLLLSGCICRVCKAAIQECELCENNAYQPLPSQMLLLSEVTEVSSASSLSVLSYQRYTKICKSVLQKVTCNIFLENCLQQACGKLATRSENLCFKPCQTTRFSVKFKSQHTFF